MKGNPMPDDAIRFGVAPNFTGQWALMIQHGDNLWIGEFEYPTMETAHAALVEFRATLLGSLRRHDIDVETGPDAPR